LRLAFSGKKCLPTRRVSDLKTTRHHDILLARSIMPPLRRKSTYPGCSDFCGQLFHANAAVPLNPHGDQASKEPIDTGWAKQPFGAARRIWNPSVAEKIGL
jgi:hypothetical protein